MSKQAQFPEFHTIFTKSKL